MINKPSIYFRKGDTMSEIHFESSLTIEEIDRNFEDVDLFSGIMEGLNEALAYEKGEAGTDYNNNSSD